LVLQKNTTLKELDLRWNNIGDEGGKAIGKALEVSPVFVSSFSFPFAVIALLSVTNLIFVLVPKQKNQTLLELHLDGNVIGDIGAAALGEGIAVSCVVRWLFFVGGHRSPLLGNST
jgi:hypothetical protein